jgi:dihydropteroate synthase
LTAAFAGLSLDRVRVMAILNVTPDSFSDGGERLDPAQAIDDGLRFVSEGADIVDVGGESTRPGSRPTAPDEELQRVLPVVEGLARRDIVVSIDTRRASVARACLDAGARIVNDISALEDDPDLMPLVVQRGADRTMHRRGRPEEKYVVPAYTDVVEEVRRFLVERAETCSGAGSPATDALRSGPRLRQERRGEYGPDASAAAAADAGYIPDGARAAIAG